MELKHLKYGVFFLFSLMLLAACSKNTDNIDFKPVGAFEISSDNVKEGEVVKFTSLAFDEGGKIAYWHWDFGDGDTSTAENPTHAYKSAGKYTVRLSVKDNDGRGNENGFSKEITVVKAPETTGTLKIVWQFNTQYMFNDASPTISSDGIIYIGNDAKSTRGEDNIYAIKNGNKVWSYLAGDVVRSTPAIGTDGTVYIGTYDKNLYAFKPDGSIKWTFDLKGNAKYSSPAIALDGTIYIGTTKDYLYAINPDGSEKWHLEADGDFNGTPVIGSDGTIYCAATDGYFYAVNADGTQKWKTQYGSWNGTNPAIGPDGTIYFGGEQKGDSLGVFIAFDPGDGSVKWKKNYKEKISYGGPAVAEDGTIYIGGLGKKLIAYTPEGNKKWSFDCGEIRCVPAIDNNGNIYFGDNTGTFYVLTPEGSLKYEPLKLGNNVWSSPLIGNDGTIYMSVDQEDKTGIVYALKSDAIGPANAPAWPMKGKNEQRTSNVKD